MLHMIGSISSLLLGIGVLLTGMGLLGTLLGVRGVMEQFSQGTIGLIMSAYFLGYVLGTYLCPSLIRRSGHVRTFTALAAVATATAILHALFVNPWAWGLLRLITGACMVGMYMVVESWLNALAPAPHRGRIFSTYVAITLVAMGIGQFLLMAGDASGFMLFGIAAIFLALGLVPVALTRVVEPGQVETPNLSLAALYKTSPLGLAGSFAAGLASSAFWAMGPVFAQGMHLPPAGIAAFMSATIIGGAALQWPIGHLSDHMDRRKVLVTVSFAGTALALSILVIAAWLPQALIPAAFVYGGVLFSIYGLSVARVNDFLAAPDVLEATRGLLAVFGIGATIGPALAGTLMESLGVAALPAYFAIVFASLGAFGLHRMHHSESVPPEEQSEFVPMVRTSQAALEMDPRAEVEPELDFEAAPLETSTN